MKSLVVVEENKVSNFEGEKSLAEKWIEFAQVKETSEKAYRKGIKNFAKYLRTIGIFDPCEVTKENVRDYRKWLESQYKSPYTRNLYITSVKLFFDFLHVEEKIIGVNPALHLKGFKTGTKHCKDAVTAKVSAKILHNYDTSTLKGKRDKALYAVLATTGLRAIEASRAVLENLVIDDEQEVYLYIKGKGRENESECVHIPAPVVVIITNYLDSRFNVDGNAILADKTNCNFADIYGNGAVFASTSNRNYGSSISTTTISTIIKKIFRANGIDNPRMVCHSLRHGFCTEALKNGATLRQVQAAARHSRIDVTTRYLHELERKENPAESIVAGAFGLI